MRAHAIVIGIDRYHEKEWCLDGAVRDAAAFAEWALAHGGVAPSDLTLLLSPLEDAPPLANPVLAAAAIPATRAAIVDTFYAYQTGRAKDADRLWFYYAGHGLAPPGSGPDAGPLVVPADVTNPDRYVQLEPVGLETFRGVMEDVPPKEQFYFVDACRDVIPVQGNKILTQQLLWDLRGLDEDMLAMQAVFLATTAGRRAKEVRGHGLFGRALIAALRGLGPELLPPPPGKSRWLLEFGAVVDFVTDAVRRGFDELTLTDPVDRKGIPYANVNGARRHITVAELESAARPKAKIGAIVEPEEAREVARIEFLKWNEETETYEPLQANPRPVGPPVPDEATFELRGGKKYLRVSAEGYVRQEREILVYEDKRIEIELEPVAEPEVRFFPEGLGGGNTGLDTSIFKSTVPISFPAATTGDLEVTCRDAMARVVVYDGGGRERARGYGRVFVESLAPGPYKVAAELTSSDRVEKTVSVRAGETERVPLELVAPAIGPAVDAALKAAKIDNDGWYANPSEHFGEVANVRLATLLAFAAWGARWPASHGFHHLRALGVDPLDGLAADGSALQVLLADAGGEVAASRASVESVAIPLAPIPAIAAGVQGSLVTSPGPVAVRVEMPGFAPAGFACVALPGFVTLLVIARDEDGDVDVQQHFVPIDPMRAEARPDDVRRVELAERALENRQPLDALEVETLLAMKGVNPMLAIVAGYRMLRMKERDELAPLIARLPELFPALPDAHVLAALYDSAHADEHFANARGTPVVAEGFWAIVQWLTARAMRDNTAPPLLRESPLPLMWTSFTTAPRAQRVDALRVVTPGGRTTFGDPQDTGVLATAAKAVGLIECASGMVAGSTMLVGPRLVLTPLHIARELGHENGDGTWTLKESARVKFELGDRAADRAIVRVIRVLRPDDGVQRERIDVCWPVLLELDADAAATPLTIARELPSVGQPVAVIAFPFRDARVPDDLFAQNFAGSSGEKHVMYGAVLDVRHDYWSVDHDCFTSGGTSGGPLVDVATGQVIGMHVIGVLGEHRRKRGTAMAMGRWAMEPELR